MAQDTSYPNSFKHLSLSRHSCPHCHCIVIDPSKSSTPIISLPSIHIEKFTNTFSFTAGKITQADQDGCLVFRRLVSSLDSPAANALRDISNATKAVYIDMKIKSIMSQEPGSLNEFGLNLSGAQIEWRWADEENSTMSYDERVENSWQFEAEADDPAGQYVTRRPCYPYIASQLTIDIIKNWIQECDSSHTDCLKVLSAASPGSQASGPSRVLDIGTTEDHRILIVNGNPAEKYVALSYCWGGDTSMQLLKSTLDDWKREVPFDELPKTIQDGIFTCRRLGVRYFWVDRLCIIQDDVEDTTKEISVMAEIYKKAYLTIIAASARSSVNGFLQSRETASEMIPRSCMALRYVCPDGRTGLVGMISKKESQNRYRPDTDAVDERAWTYQEDVLSTRSLKFCSNYLLWKCKSANASHMHNEEELKTGKAMNISYDQFESQKNIHWSGVVSEYTWREMSVPGDKLLAVSAVAKEYADFLKASGRDERPEYLAGLWRHTLKGDLYWEVNTSNPKRPRPTTYRAPSWSWASVDGGAVAFPDLEEASEMMVFEIIECSVQLVSPLAPFGSVASGYLIVKGRIVEEIWDREAERLLRQAKKDSDIENLPKGHPDAIEKDLLENEDGTIPVFCLELGRSGLVSLGIILVPAGKATYRRVGSFVDIPESIMGFEHCVPQVVTIV